MKTTVFIPVREVNGFEWVDTLSIGTTLKESMQKALECNVKVPQWAEHNQILRVSEFELKEIEK